jgi:hypothetical protein
VAALKLMVPQAQRCADVFLSTIIEGPAKWTVRPVAEVFYEKEFGQAETISALFGLIGKSATRFPSTWAFARR